MALDDTKPAGTDLVSSLDTYGQEERTAINLNTVHRTSDGSDHTFIDQSVVIGSAPSLLGTNITVVPDTGLLSGVTIITAGAADSGKLVKLDASGLIDSSCYAGIQTTSLGVVGLSVSELLRVNAGGTAIESSGKTVPTGDIVGTTDTQVLAAKTLTLPQINDTSADHQYVFAVNELAGDITVTLPLLTGADEFTFNDHTQTLTNKTLTTPTITVPVIADFTSATHDHSNNANGGTISILAASGLDYTGLVANQLLRMNAGGTAIESGGASAIVPTGLIVGISDTQTLTNKTLTSPVITTMLVDDGDTHVTVTSADQTHAAPTVTIPDIVDAADTFCMLDTAQTLTNKTVTSLTSDGVNGHTNTGAPGGALTDGFYMWSADIVAGNAAPHFYTEEGVTIKLYQVSHADQAVITPTTVGANTGTSGAGLSLIGDTSAGDESGAIMNDFVALEEDILALNTLVESMRTALIAHGLIKGSA